MLLHGACGDDHSSITDLTTICKADQTVDRNGHSSNFFQVVDESMAVVREDLNEWLQRYLFCSTTAPPIPPQFLLHRLKSGLWLSRLAYKLHQSVFSQFQPPPPQPPATIAYQFLRGAVSSTALKTVSRTSLPEFPRTLMLCATRLTLGASDLCTYQAAADAPVDPTSDGATADSALADESPVTTRRITDQWLARDNVSSFIQWCRELGIPQTVIFETTGLVHQTEEKNVLLTLMELARIASRYGLTDLPELVRIEREIDALEAARQRPDIVSTGSGDTVSDGGSDHQVDVSSNAGDTRAQDTVADVDIVDTTLPYADTDAQLSTPRTNCCDGNASASSTGIGQTDHESTMTDPNRENIKVSSGDSSIFPEHRDNGDTRRKVSSANQSGNVFVELQSALSKPSFACTDNGQLQSSKLPIFVDHIFKNVTKRRALREDIADTTPVKRIAIGENIFKTPPSNLNTDCSSTLRQATPCSALRILNLNRSISPSGRDGFMVSGNQYTPASVSTVYREAMHDTHKPNRRVGIDMGYQLVADQVDKKLALCTCCNRLHMQRLDEGRYRLGNRIYYLRQFRNHVMVRVGGGWLTLDAFLNRYDPCRKGNSTTTQRTKPVQSSASSPSKSLANSVDDLRNPATGIGNKEMDKYRHVSKAHLTTGVQPVAIVDSKASARSGEMATSSTTGKPNSRFSSPRRSSQTSKPSLHTAHSVTGKSMTNARSHTRMPARSRQSSTERPTVKREMKM